MKNDKKKIKGIYILIFSLALFSGICTGKYLDLKEQKKIQCNLLDLNIYKDLRVININKDEYCKMCNLLNDKIDYQLSKFLHHNCTLDELKIDTLKKIKEIRNEVSRETKIPFYIKRDAETVLSFVE